MIDGFPWWQVGAGANAVVAVAYLAIFVVIAANIRRNGQWRTNPLAAATAAIFLTCGVHHGSHAVHLMMPGSGHAEMGLREAFDSPWISGWDVVTAGVGLWYWTQRGRFPALVRGAALFDDLAVRRHQAMELHDGVVQGLATAKLALELGKVELAADELDRTLENSKSIITALLLDGDDVASPGSLRRRTAARP